MHRRAAVAMAVLAGALAVAAPVLVSLELAKRQGEEDEAARLRALAHDVRRRSADTRGQFIAAVEALKREGGAAPCSDEQIALMHRIDVDSSYLQAVGAVVGDRLVCSSLGRHGDGVALGAGDGTNRLGVRLWSGIELPMAPGRKFNIVEKDGYAAIIHPDLVIDILADQKDFSIANFSIEPRKLLRSRGPIKREWIDGFDGKADKWFSDGEYLVVILLAENRASASLAATRVTAVDERVRRVAATLVPLGILAGTGFALAIFFIARQQMSLRSELQAAVRRRQFTLVYQPLIELESGRCVGAEALIRWRRADGTQMRPDIFIPVAEENGLIQRITGQVMDIVARESPELLRRHPDFHIAINLSSADLQSERTAGLLDALVERAGVQPRNFMVEATERGFMNIDVARPVVRELRAKGIRVAIDDFGTGYSSLSYLESFELDFLKIDKAFVDTLGTQAATSQVALHIIEMAKALKLEMIAEGVETEAQATFLRERGVQYAQGWLFGRPMPMNELAAFVAARGSKASPPAQ